MVELEKTTIDFFTDNKKDKVTKSKFSIDSELATILFILLFSVTALILNHSDNKSVVSKATEKYYLEKNTLVKNVLSQSPLQIIETKAHIKNMYKNEIKQLVKHHYMEKYLTNDEDISNDFATMTKLNDACHNVNIYYYHLLRNLSLIQNKNNDNSIEAFEQAQQWIELSKNKTPYMTTATSEIIHSISVKQKEDIKMEQYLEENKENINKVTNYFLEKFELKV